MYYLNENINDTLNPPLFPGDKSTRGLNHPKTATLLLPLEWDVNDEYVFAIQCYKYLCLFQSSR
jgi:hypothetical protein